MKEFLASYTKEELDKVVKKFQEFEVGFPFLNNNYIPFSEANKSSASVYTWAKLVYPRKDSKGSGDKFSKQVIDLKNAANSMFEKAESTLKKNKAIPTLEGERDPNVIFVVENDREELIEFTYEELAIFLYAAFQKRYESEKYLIAKAKYESNLADEKSNISKKEIKAQRIKEKEDLLKEFPELAKIK